MAGTLHAADIPADWLTFGGRKNDVNWQAKWIWLDDEAGPRNLYLCARRDFDLTDTAGAAFRLHVSADSRYRLYVNGEWIGDGPARSFYWAQQFDTYDVGDLLRDGANTLAVLVSHYGEGTFQYDPSGQAGLLVQLERSNEPRGSSHRSDEPRGLSPRISGEWRPILTTDESWQVRRHDGYLRPTMRISCQMPFEEMVDGRLLPPDWMAPAGRLPDAGPAKVIGPVGTPPWTTMVGRSVPFLTREPIAPVRLWKAERVKLPDLGLGFTVRPYLLPGYFMQNHRELKGFAATTIDSPVEQTIRFPHTCDRAELPIVNGQVAEHDKPVPLHKGPNLCVIAMQPGNHHEFDRIYCAFLESPQESEPGSANPVSAVTLKGVFNDETAWTIFGPFDDYGEVHRRVTKARSVADLEPFKASAKIVRPEDILTHGSAWEESRSARPVPGDVRIESAEALFGSKAAVSTVYPPEERAAGETSGGTAVPAHSALWLDFGRELVGNTELDLDAPAGCVLTFNFLEEIEDGKRIHYTGDNHGGLRYVTAGGRQRFTSFLRRGYRYMQLIVGNAAGPVRLRGVRTIFATYPAVETGAFACSDPLLTKIWQVGRHTLRCCSEDTYTDCPTYEQTYWVGDGRNEAMVDYAAYGNLALARRCAELPALSLQRQLLTESQVPSAWDNLLTAWSLLWVQMTEEHYQYSGDREYLTRIYPAVSRMLHNIRDKLTDERGLLSIEAWNLFDWAGQDIGHRLVTHNQMFLAEAIRRAAYMARELGKADEAKYWDDYRSELIAAINQHLWDEQKGAYIDAIRGDGKPSPIVSQQTNSLALLYGVAPPERAARIEHAPDSPPPGMVTVGSPFALFYMLDALVHDGRHAEAMAIIRDRWGQMVKHGATTFWETFPGFDKNWWTRSYCHAWSAAPTYFLSRCQLGAWWDQPGYRVARIAPVPLDLTWARGAVPTPHGPINVAWEKSAEKFTIEVELPKPVAAVVDLPVPADTFPNVTPADLKPRIVDGCWRIDLPAGAAVTVAASRK
ncbi:MAG: alpha-L-rhamnosidase N-terminal domain-containing protein [Planctomycetes bacterium]|nr:alpha-L-rhamnosidase N-terminal domain-containing protein [Planctomycetota bacterium]